MALSSSSIEENPSSNSSRPFAVGKLKKKNYPLQLILDKFVSQEIRQQKIAHTR